MTLARAMAARLQSGSATRRLGRKGEAIAARYLRQQSYKILARNVITSRGEIDIIARSPSSKAIIFIEVKTRARAADAAAAPIAPEVAITAGKQRKLISLAAAIARQRNWQNYPLRIDIIAVETTAAGRGKPAIRHYQDAIRPR